MQGMILNPILATKNLCQFCCIYACINCCFNTIIAENGNNLDAGNDTEYDSCNNLFASDTYIWFGWINFSLNTITADNGNTFKGSDDASITCKPCLCIQNLHTVWLYYSCVNFSSNALIAVTGKNLDAGDYAASNMLNTDAGQILAKILAASITCIQFVQKNGFYSKLDFLRTKVWQYLFATSIA